MCLQSAAYDIQRFLKGSEGGKVERIPLSQFNLFDVFNSEGLNTIQPLKYTEKTTVNARVNLFYRERMLQKRHYILPTDTDSWLLAGLAVAVELELTNIRTVKHQYYDHMLELL